MPRSLLSLSRCVKCHTITARSENDTNDGVCKQVTEVSTGADDSRLTTCGGKLERVRADSLL